MRQPPHQLPDVPRWIEVRAMLQSHRARIEYERDGIIISDRFSRLAAVIGTPSFETLLLETEDAEEVLCTLEDRDWVGSALETWDSEIATLYTLPSLDGLEPGGVGVSPLTCTVDLEHLEAELRDEIVSALARHEVLATEVDGNPVSFAYAAWQTEGFFDIAVDTAEAFRRQGLARAVVSELIRRCSATGRRAVWGAVESNVASHEFAQSLGFVPSDQLAVFTRPKCG